MSAAFRLVSRGVLLLASFASFAASGAVAENRSHWFGHNYIASGDDLRVADPIAGNALLAGGRVQIDSPVSGDLSLAAGEVIVTAPVTGALRVAGGKIELRGPVGGKLWVTGGEIAIDASVGGPSWLAGGNFRTGPQAAFADATTINAGDLVLDGRFNGPLTVRAGRVTLRGQFRGDVAVHADQLVIDPEAQLEGRLRYDTPDPLTESETAHVRGAVEHGSFGRYRVGFVGAPFRLHGLGSFIVLLVLGAGVLAVAPAFAARVQAGLFREPWTSFGVGLLTLVAVPLAAILIAVTIIGIPVALLVLCAYGGLLLLGYLLGAHAIGAHLLARMRPAQQLTFGYRLAALAVVLAILGALQQLPGIGRLVHGLVLLGGLGATVSVLRHRDRGAAPPAPSSA
jgi:hypothetical protein